MKRHFIRTVDFTPPEKGAQHVASLGIEMDARSNDGMKASRLVRWVCDLALSVLVAASVVSSVAASPDLSYLLNALDAVPDGGWVKVNTNKYSDAWATGLDAVPGPQTANPAAIVFAWSSIAWDSNRGNLLLWGGGHANYKGNEIYVWKGATGVWTRGSLPSQVEPYGTTGIYFVVDDAAPQSAHTYDGNAFLPLSDLFVTFGGAAFNFGEFVIKDGDGRPRRAGPWMWDPRRADANMVGGTTGSGYDPTRAGGTMWRNEQGRWVGAEPPSYVEITSSYATENGRDVVYLTGDSNASGWPGLYRYELGDVRNDGFGRFERVGVSWNVPSFASVATIDSWNNLYIRTSTFNAGLVVWDLGLANAADPSANRDLAVQLVNKDGTPFTVSKDHGIAFDEVRGKIVLWDGLAQGTVWETEAAISAAGEVSGVWVVNRRESTTVSQPHGNFVTGVKGKWQFVAQLGAFVALDEYDDVTKDAGVWLYKPIGWRHPGSANVPPTVVLTSPVTGTSVLAPASVVVSADASDGDGSVSRVDFYAGATLIGSDSTAPYSVTWSNVGAGSYALTAVAVDNAWGEHDVGGGEPDGDGGGERAADGGADESGDWDECGGAGERGGECGRE